MKRYLIIVSAFLAFGVAANSQKSLLLHFYVEAGSFQRINTPVSVDLEGVVKNDTLEYQLVEKVKGQLEEKPFQVEPGYVPRLWWILDGTTEAGKKKSFSFILLPRSR